MNVRDWNDMTMEELTELAEKGCPATKKKEEKRKMNVRDWNDMTMEELTELAEKGCRYYINDGRIVWVAEG